MQPPVPRDANTKRILVIEDNPDGREMLHAALSLDGHRIETAPDGLSGIEIASKTSPDIVLIDIGLPDIDGYEVARRLREDGANKRLLLIAMTGYGQVQDERRAVAAGFNLHLVKPVTAEQLKQVIGTLEGAH